MSDSYSSLTPIQFVMKDGGDVVSPATPFPGAGWSTILSSGSGFSAAGITINPMSALQSSASQACVDRVASDCAKLPIKLLRKMGNQFVRVHDHYLLDLIARPNRRHTRYEMIYQMVYNYQATGNGYVVVAINKKGLPVGLIPIALGKTTLIEKPSGAIEYHCTSNLFNDYLTSKPEQRTARRTIDEEEMMQLRRMSIDGVRGTSVFATASEVFGLALACQELAAKTFKNGACFGFVITTPLKLNPQQVEQTQNDAVRNMSGIINAGKPPIMHSGSEIVKISMTPEETQMLAAREHIDAEICRLLGVPAALVGIKSGDASTYKNLESDMRSYVDSTLMNILTPFEELLNLRLLFDPDGKDVPQGGAVRGEYKFEFDTSALLRADKQARYAAYQVGVNSHVLTPNEARAEEGYPARPDGNDFPENARTINLNRGGAAASTGDADDTGDEAALLPDADDA